MDADDARPRRPQRRGRGPDTRQERLRDVFAATDGAHARRCTINFYVYCADADVPELTRLRSCWYISSFPRSSPSPSASG